MANDQILNIGTKSPGFTITMLKVRKNKEIKKKNFLKVMMFGQETPYDLIPISKTGSSYDYRFDNRDIVFNEYRRSEYATREINVGLINIIYPKSISNKTVISKGDSIFFYDVNDVKIGNTIQVLQSKVEEEHIIEKTYILGTDRYGRDILSRLVIGVRVSLSVGFIAVLISLLIGVTMGALAGYLRSKVDTIIMWIINVIWSIPTLLLIFAITLALGRGFWQIFVAVGLTMWVEVARIIRGQVMVIREQEFIEAARSLGFSNFRIIRMHVLPNVLGPVMVIAAANFAAAIIIEAGLSYLGIGVQPPMPSWGMMMKEHSDYLVTHQPFLAIVPGVAVMLMVLAFNLVGNGFRDALDVKAKFRSY